MPDVCDLYDTEVNAVFEVLARLQDRAKFRRHNYNDFDREIREAFANIGFTVEVNWHEFEVAGQKQDGAMPEVTVTGRTDPGFTFDKDRQVHEVTHNVLGLPEADAGVIKTDPETLKRFTGDQGHGHGHSHG